MAFVWGLGVGFGFGFGSGGGRRDRDRGWFGGVGVFGRVVGGMGKVGEVGVVTAICFSIEAAYLGWLFVPIGAHVRVRVVLVASGLAAFGFVCPRFDE